MRTQDLVVGFNNQPTLYTAVTIVDPVQGLIPFNVLSLAFAFVVKNSAKDADSAAIANLTTANSGIVVTDVNNGLLNILVSAAATSRLGDFAYRLDAINAARPTTILRGKFTVEAV